MEHVQNILYKIYIQNIFYDSFLFLNKYYKLSIFMSNEPLIIT